MLSNRSEVENVLADGVLDMAFSIHREVGPGMLESVYEMLLSHALVQAGYEVRRQVAVPVVYRGLTFEEGFRLDLLVNDVLVVEIKSVEAFEPVHFKQLQTYLKLANKRLGLRINFNSAFLRQGVKRVVNDLYPQDGSSPSPRPPRRREHPSSP